MKTRPNAAKSNKSQYICICSYAPISWNTYPFLDLPVDEVSVGGNTNFMFIFIRKYFILNVLIVCFGLLIFSHIMEMLEI